MPAFFIAMGLIFVAELGDKSQLVALWFATRYRWWIVISGVTVATLIVHLFSTAIGETASHILPESVQLIIVGLSFYAFAWWGLRGDTLNEEATPTGLTRFCSFGLVTTAFFVSEIGDKTQLATMSIAGNHPQFVAVWLGSTIGMVAADGLAIAVGAMARRSIPERSFAVLAAVLFGIFGTIALIRAATLLA